jgi:phosphoserine phosphatase
MVNKSSIIGTKWKLNKEKLYRLRINKGWTQEMAAERCEIYNVRQYIRLENGETLRPRTSTLKSLGNGFEIDEIEKLILLSGAKPLKSDHDFYLLNKTIENNILNYRFKPIYDADKLIVLGIDDTILKGYDFAWKLIWDYLKIEDEIRRNWIRDFHQGKINCKKWVQIKSEIFIEKKLNINDFASILKDVYVIDGFDEFIKYCKKNNYALAIVSGGIDTVLEFMIPDYQDIFNYVTVNKFFYDKKGYLKKVCPTPYDFKTKIDGINEIQHDINLSPADTTFIGGGYNNIHTLHASSKCISINTKSIQLIEGFNYNIEKPNLKEVIRFLE